MFKDDRFISILSGVVLMAAIGTIVQRGGGLVEYFDPQPAPVLMADSATATLGTPVRIDVLANDTVPGADVASRLAVVEGGSCGAVSVVDGVVMFTASPRCGAEEIVRYRIEGDRTETTGIVTVSIAMPEATPQAEEPVVARAPEMPAIISYAPIPDPVLGNAPRVGQAPSMLARPMPGGDSGAFSLGSRDDASAPMARLVPGQLRAGTDRPAAVQAPAEVAAPSSGRAPGSMRAPQGIQAPAVTTDVATAPAASRAPAGLFGGGRRVATQAAPDPSRPAGTMPVDQVLARAPQPLAEMPGAMNLSPGTPSIAIRRPGVVEGGPQRMTAPGGLRMDVAAMDTSPAVSYSTTSPGIGVQRQRPEDLRISATISMAQIDRSIGAVNAPGAPVIGGGPSRLDAAIPRANLPSIGDQGGDRVAFAAPSSGLGDVRNRAPVNLAPVNTALPAGLSQPVRTDDLPVTRGGGELPSFDPDAVAVGPVETEAPAQAAPADEGRPEQTRLAALIPQPRPRPDRTSAAVVEPDAPRVAALPSATAACVVLPALTIDPQRAGHTAMILTSPCHAGTVAELHYSGLRVAVPLDADGEGAVTAMGLEPVAQAAFWFADGKEFAFNLPFEDMDRIERVALAWDAPVRLELHALEFGAGLGSSGHVFSGNAKDFSSVRRSGGGYLTRFAAVGGIGQSVEIYTHWRGGATGVVRMMIDFSSRHRDQQAGTCGTGPLAAPAFTIYRSSGGELERPLNRRLSAMDCSRVASTTSHLIEAAVDDVIVTGR